MKKFRIRNGFALILAMVFFMTMLTVDGTMTEGVDRESAEASSQSRVTEKVSESVEPGTGDGVFISGQENSTEMSPALLTEEAEVWDGTVDFSWYDSNQTEFYLSKPAQLAGLAALVNGRTDVNLSDDKISGDSSLLISHKIENFQLTGAGGGNQFATVYQGDASFDFAGKTIYLTEDMDMGGVYDASSGSWSGPNWTPIGGKYPMDTETGDYLIESFFNGVLDGQGHNIKNLYCNRFTQRGYAYSQAIGLVGYLGGLYDDEVLPEGWQPAVRNLTVSGDVYGRRMVGGIVGNVGSTDYGVVIENCANYAEIRNTDSKGVGGICGAGMGKGMIRNCYNRGNVTTTYSCPAGGICGRNGGMDLYNCYNTGIISSNGQKRGRGIGGHESGSYIVDNCFFLEGCDDDPDHPGYYSGTALNIQVSAEGMTEERMKSPEMIDALNGNGGIYVIDAGNRNDGFPVLYFQVQGYDSQTMHTIRLEQSDGGTIGLNGESTVPHGTVVQLTEDAAGGFIFQNFTADGNDFAGSFYTVLKDVTISGKFSVMKKGTVVLKNSDECTVSLRKTGVITNENGEAENVSRVQVRNGDAIYEGDALTATAHLRKGMEPEDSSREYTGAFRYFFQYSNREADTTERGTHKVNSSIQGGTLTVSAEPVTRNKNWAALADSSWYSGDREVYEIQSAEQLAGLALLVNTGTDFSGVTFNLTKDISLANSDGTKAVREWSAIGSGSANAFKGIFDGNGHVVSDMTAVSGGSYSGLFGYCRDAVIRNITVKGSSAAQGSAAGIAGHLNGGIITDCISRVEVTSTGQYAAGIASGLSNGAAVSRCRNYGTVSGTSSVAGIAGGSAQMTDQISDCVNYGDISGSSSLSGGTGGVAGILGGGVIRCANYGKVSGKGWYTGGLVGHSGSADTNTLNTSFIRDSYNQGEVLSENQTASAAVGGLVGYAQYLNMDNCYNTGGVALNNSTSSYRGSVAGRFYRSVYNRIDHTVVLTGSCDRVMDVDDSVLDYVHVNVLSASEMGTADFCAEMNDYAGDSVFTVDDYPVFFRLNENEMCTVVFTGDYSGSQKVRTGDSAALPPAPDGELYSFTVDGIPWNGNVVTGDTTVSVSKTHVWHTVSFYADNRFIAEVKYRKDDTSVKEPPIPEKTGYTAHWPEYSLNGDDVTVTAVYERQPLYGGSTIAENEVYSLAAGATGVITVSEDVHATLDGSEGAAEVQILLEKGASLTLKDVETSYNGSVLIFKGDNRLTLQGDNRVIGASSESNNPDPSILAEGSVIFDGAGCLYADARTGNTAMQLNPGAEMIVDGPKVKLFKYEKLGIDGGVLNGMDGSVIVNSGLLSSYSNSDNLFAVSIGSFTQNGGSVLFLCDDHEHSIRTNKVELNGGSFFAQGRSHEDPSVYYHHADAVECDGFSSAYNLTEVNVGSTGAPYTVSSGNTSVVDGAYQAVLFDEGKRFEITCGDTLYVWNRNGQNVTVTGVEGTDYTVMLSGNTVIASFAEELTPGAVIAGAAYDRDGFLVDYVSADVSPTVSFDMNLEDASVIRIHVLKSREDMTPLLPQTELALKS